jgi:hypothetical protein
MQCCKWGKVPSAACALCGHPAETQSHIQCLCPVLKEAQIQAHHNMAHRLLKGIEDSTDGWIIVTEQTVEGLQGLPQQEEQIDSWQRTWDEVTDELLEGEEGPADANTAVRRKRPDAWAKSSVFSSSNLRCRITMGPSSAAPSGVGGENRHTRSVVEAHMIRTNGTRSCNNLK